MAGRPVKPTEEYEAEALRVGDCLITPHLSTHTARRLYQRRHGKLRSDQLVCHTCDTPRCINDDHHFVGTSQDNVRDAVAKGRHSCLLPPNGRGNPGKPHTEEAKRKISASGKKAWEKRRA